MKAEEKEYERELAKVKCFIKNNSVIKSAYFKNHNVYLASDALRHLILKNPPIKGKSLKRTTLTNSSC